MAKPKIRPIAICLFRQGDRILVAEGYDAQTGKTFCRPLGGGIDFGETSQAAIAREVQEELGADITDSCLLGILESIFSYNGELLHEIVFVYDARFADSSWYEKPVLQVQEGKRQFKAHWRSLDDLQATNLQLVPEQLWTLL
ncbi:MAG: NUDIX hydrolase [Leptolyngbyaceae cyanobacterium SM1_1_3]|nr:NUDIX hydrolase [Leptolyngbyaceae cyanobacterium SM1_1_3]NJN02370.1 NUDIX hydrolase [Leptolyngbyaceae cyanobacterium RM1_1_2]NJO10404.1 NUDIX hydrolase [Leptolyngbyaceae cyanobacterium SL_1_1]